MYMSNVIWQPQNWSNSQLNQLREKLWQLLNITQPVILPLPKLFLLHREYLLRLQF